MAREIINIGAYPNDGQGDPLRTAFQKINNNFASLFGTGFVVTESTTTGSAPNQVILEYPANLFAQGLIQIRSYNPNNNDMQNVILSATVTNDLAAVKFTGFATTFDGNPLCRYDMDVFSGNVRVLVNPLQNVSISHYISYQITDVSLLLAPAPAAPPQLTQQKPSTLTVKSKVKEKTKR